MNPKNYHPLTPEQIEQLRSQGCSADDWACVQAVSGFLPERVQDVHFSGEVRLGDLRGSVRSETGLQKPAGIYHAYLANCTIGDGVRIARIHGHLAGYTISDGAWIEDVGTMETTRGATFGNGIEIKALNEGGGRKVTLINGLSAQIAFLQCLVRWRPKLAERLRALAQSAAKTVQGDRGHVGARATIISARQIVDVNVGNGAVVRGAASLENGTILSCLEDPTYVGANVVAKDFIFAAGACVDTGALVTSSFVGQGCKIARQFSSVSSLFFANSEALLGEACNLFAGPYSVTHHKSTLLIAAYVSFFNAGSGTNQSNHMYKLGPVHEGKLQRGCKTGSFAYMKWPSRVGPFSVVLGKHMRSLDTRDFPFSYLKAGPNGHSELLPGLCLISVGTYRDGMKWPQRDRRKSPVRRDIVDFDVLSPLTVGRMLRGLAKLDALIPSTDSSRGSVTIDGMKIRRVMLRKGLQLYEDAVGMYLQGQLVQRIEQARREGISVVDALHVDSQAVFSQEWIDLAGQMMPEARFDAICTQIESGEFDSVEAVQAALEKAHAAYRHDEWSWAAWAYEKHFGIQFEEMSTEQLREAALSWRDLRVKYLQTVLADATKEFDTATRTGFSVLAGDELRDKDFEAVRGTYDDNKFIEQVRAEIAEVAERAQAICSRTR